MPAPPTCSRRHRQDQRRSRPYARYNLGVALVRSGDAARGTALLDELGRHPPPTRRLAALRDKANVALGFAALTDDKPRGRRAADLERVRLTSMQANKALLGFGWAAAALKAAQAARWCPGPSSPQPRCRATPPCSRRASRCPMPTPSWAPTASRSSATTTRLARSIARGARSTSRSPRSAPASCSTACSSATPATRWAGSGTSSELPEMPHAGHLAQVLAQHEFQEAFKNYRDLQLPDQEPAGLGRQARRLRRHAGQPPQGLCRAAAAGARAGASDSWASSAMRKRRDDAGRRGRHAPRPQADDAGLRRRHAARAARPPGRRARHPRARRATTPRSQPPPSACAASPAR